MPRISPRLRVKLTSCKWSLRSFIRPGTPSENPFTASRRRARQRDCRSLRCLTYIPARHPLHDPCRDTSPAEPRLHASGAQHGEPVAKVEQFVKPVRNIDDGHAGAFQILNDLKERLRFRCRKRRSWLIENQTLRSLIERPGNLHNLPAAQRELCRLRAHTAWACAEWPAPWRSDDLLLRRSSKQRRLVSSRPAKMFSLMSRLGSTRAPGGRSKFHAPRRRAASARGSACLPEEALLRRPFPPRQECASRWICPRHSRRSAH